MRNDLQCGNILFLRFTDLTECLRTHLYGCLRSPNISNCASSHWILIVDKHIISRCPLSQCFPTNGLSKYSYVQFSDQFHHLELFCFSKGHGCRQVADLAFSFFSMLSNARIVRVPTIVMMSRAWMSRLMHLLRRSRMTTNPTTQMLPFPWYLPTTKYRRSHS